MIFQCVVLNLMQYRAVGRPYIKQSSTDELKLLSIVLSLLQTVARVFTQQLPWQLQACTAEVRLDLQQHT